MKLKDFDGRIWNPRFKQFGVLEGEITTEGEIGGKSVLILPIYNDEAEIELYTGFRDSNKLDKVFVGDIIKYSWRNQEKIGQVVDWEFNNSCGFNVSTKGEFLSLGVIEILEILGNIHENPELIGGEE